MQRVTIDLPDMIFRQLLRVAEATHQPVETLVAQSVISNLPPSVDNAAPELQPELLNLQTLSMEELQVIAQAQVEPAQHQRHTELLSRHEAQSLTAAEQQELSSLRQAADHLMLRKAYAWSLLRWRGQRLPALAEMPLPL